MARLPYPDPASLSAEAQEALARLPGTVNVFSMLAHAETCLKPVMRLGGAILGKQKLDARLREICLLHAMRLQHGEYEYVQHVPVAKALGATGAQIAALEAGRADDASFSDADRAALRFTREVVEKVAASEAALAGVRRFLSDREVVELIVMVGFYSMLARLTESTGVELDEPKGQAIVDGIQKRLKERSAKG